MLKIIPEKIPNRPIYTTLESELRFKEDPIIADPTLNAKQTSEIKIKDQPAEEILKNVKNLPSNTQAHSPMA